MNDDAHQIEPELLQAPPRLLKKRAGGKGSVVMSVGFLIFMTAIGALCAQLAYGTAQAKYRGVTVPAKIDGRRISRGRRSTSYYLHYRYAWRGRETSDDANVRREDYENLRDGTPVQARLWPPRPDRDNYLILPDGRETVWLPGMLLGAVFVPLFGATPLLLDLSEAKKQKSLLSRGIPTAALVESVRSAGRDCVIRYHYATGANQEMQRASHSLRKTAAPAENQLVTVLYDARKPRRSMLYAYRDYDIAPDA